VPSTSSRPCGVSSVFQRNNHSGGSRKRKITLDSTDPEIMIEKKELEILERDEITAFLTSLLPDILFHSGGNVHLRLKFEFIISRVATERNLMCSTQ
jgi:hypothetical protein